ncbi:MAG: hypothetical protein A2070_00925 [Bdellovibrionales bacterium GWC1_52_8]|nr:MAG: hypothetical protein A2X97_12375 [Bdellovibrionales bacterium GWA1_52_35]OFZ39739.1 MAG: hypothetical protein A2070_00925 [Bdellovibrionales bacterium GWC1_52_8]HCM41631.1 hypothetical protein [Bdellovibrionales bacterium]
MELTRYRDYRAFLKDELERRIASNPKYSLRAFSRDIRVSPQILSNVLNGKRGISIEVAAEIADRLGLTPDESSRFIDLVLYVHAKNAAAKKIIEFKIEEKAAAQSPYSTLDVEAFKAISDWYHNAILELVETKGFKNDPRWIAARLGISIHETQQAVQRLKQLELLEEDEKRGLKKTEINLTASYGVPSSAIRKFSRQVLQKAIESLDEQTLDERDITTMTMAIDPDRLQDAAKMISQFRRKLTDFLEQGNRTEVYTFVPALFRLTRKK